MGFAMLSLSEFLRESIAEKLMEAEQEITSATTSLNQVPAGDKKLCTNGTFKKGQTIVAVGGGRRDLATKYIKDNVGADNHVDDPFNRSKEHNDQVEKDHTGKADHVTLHNVANVIKDDEHLHQALEKSKRYMHPEHGQFHMSVYVGDRSGKGKLTQGDKSWQRNAPLKDYLPHVKNIFPESEYTHTVKNGLISVKRK